VVRDRPKPPHHPARPRARSLPSGDSFDDRVAHVPRRSRCEHAHHAVEWRKRDRSVEPSGLLTEKRISLMRQPCSVKSASQLGGSKRTGTSRSGWCFW
jgi:hypothetical protein